MSLRPSVLGLVLALVAGAVLVPGSSATTIHVNVAGGADYTTIGEGLAAAGVGDTVLVAAGTYSGASNRGMFFGSRKVLMSESGAAVTIIDAEEQGGILSISQAMDSTAVIKGFTFTRGYRNNGGGGAISVYLGAPSILDCVFRNNTTTGTGGAIETESSTGTVIISGCLFEGNSTGGYGGAVTAGHSPTRVTNCVFRNNSQTTVSTALNYGGGGLCAYVCTVQVSGCTFIGNSARTGAGGIKGYAATLTVDRSIVAFGTEGEGITGGTVTNSVIFGNAGGDTLSAGASSVLYVDPLFCSAASGDLTLCADSPCLPGSAANPTGQLIGALGEGCAACGTPVVRATWGGVKALFR